MNRNNYRADFQTNKRLINLEIKKFIRDTNINYDSHYYFLTLTQDKMYSSFIDSEIFDDFEQLFSWMKFKTNNRTHSDKRNLSAICVIEDDENDYHIRKHMHVIIAVPDSYKFEFDKIVDGWKDGLSSKAAIRWRSMHPKGSFHISPLPTHDDIERVANYNFKASTDWKNKERFADFVPYRIKLSSQRRPNTQSMTA